MSATPVQNAKYEHLHVVVRLDGQPQEVETCANRVALTRAFWSIREAEDEVSRLSEVNSEKDCRYMRLVARIQRQAKDPTR